MPEKLVTSYEVLNIVIGLKEWKSQWSLNYENLSHHYPEDHNRGSTTGLADAGLSLK